jgi:hypothetical protein
MFGNMMGDSVIAALRPQVEKAIEPLFLEARATMLTKIAGPPPKAFKDRCGVLFSFTPEELRLIWEAACESVL